MVGRLHTLMEALFIDGSKQVHFQEAGRCFFVRYSDILSSKCKKWNFAYLTLKLFFLSRLFTETIPTNKKNIDISLKKRYPSLKPTATCP